MFFNVHIFVLVIDYFFSDYIMVRDLSVYMQIYNLIRSNNTFAVNIITMDKLEDFATMDQTCIKKIRNILGIYDSKYFDVVEADCKHFIMYSLTFLCRYNVDNCTYLKNHIYNYIYETYDKRTLMYQNCIYSLICESFDEVYYNVLSKIIKSINIDPNDLFYNDDTIRDRFTTKCIYNKYYINQIYLLRYIANDTHKLELTDCEGRIIENSVEDFTDHHNAHYTLCCLTLLDVKT